jgi:Tol biopolymer transport system component
MIMTRFLAQLLSGLAALMPAVSSFAEEVTPTEHRGSYALNGRIHVGLFGHPDGKPLTDGPADMKPSWSKEGDLLVFFRITKYAPRIPDWKTAICVVKADGTGFRKLTDGTHTDFNPTWTRDGSNLAVLNRQKPKSGGYVVMLARPDGVPGEEYAVSDTRLHTYAYSCLKDGRMFVSSSRKPSKSGYFLMRPDREGNPVYEPIQCDLAKQGRLDRVSVTPDETRVCFELQKGFGEYRYPGRALYVADFDAKTPAVTNPKVIANEAFQQDVTYLYPRWTRDQSAVVYHSNKSGKNQLYMYRLEDGATLRVSADPKGDYMFPHGEATPK